MAKEVLTILLCILVCSEAQFSSRRYSSAFPKGVVNNGHCIQRPSLSPLPNPLPDELIQALEQVDQIALNVSKIQNTPGVSVIIIYDQDVLWYKGYGTVNLSQPSDTPNGDSIFRLGSITKVFATLALLQMRDLQLLNLDDPVSKFNPNIYINGSLFPPSKRGMTLRQLSCHLAGLPREAPCNFFACDLTNDEMYERLHRMKQIYPTDTMPIYTNLGFSLLGHVLEEIAGVKYEDYIQENILDPLGMTNTGFNFTQEIIDKMAVGYDTNGEPDPYYYTSLGWSAPCGQMYSTANDLAKLMSFLFQTEVSDGIIDSATIREMFLPIFMDNDRTTGFGLPWEFEYYGGYMTRTKRGDVPGFASEMILVQELKLGIVVLANTMEEASPIAVPIAQSFIAAFNDVMQNLETYDLPYNYEDYLGEYLYVGESVTISFNSSANQLYYSGAWGYGPLEYVEDYWMRLLPPDVGSADCLNEQVDQYYQFFEFNEVDGIIQSLWLPGLDITQMYVKQN